VFLKARPTLPQLVSRLAPPVPDGIELYLHEDDVRDDDWLPTLRGRFGRLATPPGFTWVVEGPVWSLDGALFGLCRNDETDRELVRRLVALAASLGAVAVNIHCVDGSPDAGVLQERRHDEALERAYPFLAWYAALCHDAGLLPLVENVPPVCRMRRQAFIYTPIGVLPGDLVACVQAVPGLGLTLDTSHAQLAVNAGAGVAPEAAASRDLQRALAYYRDLGGPRCLSEFVDAVLPWVVGVHVANAAGLLAEGLPHDQGDADLAPVVRQLAGTARYFVTEPIDQDEQQGALKRAMQGWLLALLGRAPAAAPPAGAARGEEPPA
jgi:sugar phosphate isomerase/epimerase